MCSVVVFGLLACLAYRTEAAATIMDISTCTDLVSAAAATTTGNIAGNLIEDIVCDEWTDINITQNKLKLYGESTTFTNARFVVSDGAILRADVLVAFTGDGVLEADYRTVNGGVLNVAKGGKARFLKDLYVRNAGITTTADQMVHGGCIYSQGYLRFESRLVGYTCKNVGEDGVAPGNGSGLWNGPDGKVVFKSSVNMGNNGSSADGGWTSNFGGAIYSEGEISFFESSAYFVNNVADKGGAIYNAGVLKFLKRASASFSRNKSVHDGGQIYNEGILVLRNEGAFRNGYAGGSGGAIYNHDDGVMTFIKDVEFTGNVAEGHGGAVYISFDAVDYLPEDATYLQNRIRNPDEDFYCDDVYVNGELEDDYTCLP